VKEAGRADAFCRLHAEPELQVALVELLVRLCHAPPHAALPARLRSCCELRVHPFDLSTQWSAPSLSCTLSPPCRIVVEEDCWRRRLPVPNLCRIVCPPVSQGKLPICCEIASMGFKIRYPYGLEGSSPSFGTREQASVMRGLLSLGCRARFTR